MLAKECDGGILAGLARRHGEHERRVFVLAGVEVTAVHAQEYIGSRSTNPLVAVDEWMIQDHVEQVGGRHRRKTLMEVLSVEAGFRHGDRRLEQSKIADTLRSAVAADHFGVDGEDLVEVKEYRDHDITRPAV